MRGLTRTPPFPASLARLTPNPNPLPTPITHPQSPSYRGLLALGVAAVGSAVIQGVSDSEVLRRKVRAGGARVAPRVIRPSLTRRRAGLLRAARGAARAFETRRRAARGRAAAPRAPAPPPLPARKPRTSRRARPPPGHHHGRAARGRVQGGRRRRQRAVHQPARNTRRPGARAAGAGAAAAVADPKLEQRRSPGRPPAGGPHPCLATSSRPLRPRACVHSHRHAAACVAPSSRLSR